MNETRLRALIVDDEPLARARTRRMLEELGNVEIVGEAGSVAEALQQAAAAPPDVVLLDIQMPGESGFALIEQLEPCPSIVFVTAFDQYAVRAFEANAVDYLLKPFRLERLAAALARVRDERRDPAALEQRLRDLLANLQSSPAPRLARFTVRVGAKQRIVRVEDVLWFGAEDKLVFAAVRDDRHYINFTLDELERRLDPEKFARVHRGVIVQLDHAVALRPGFAGTWRLQLDDEARTELPVSRSRARTLKARLGA